MDVLTLQNECKSLAAGFPELRHAIVVRNATEHETDGLDIDRSDAVIRRMGLTVIHRQYLKMDLRSHLFAIWGGESRQRAEEANERFDGLAVHAVKAVPLTELAGAVAPTAPRGTRAIVPAASLCTSHRRCRRIAGWPISSPLRLPTLTAMRPTGRRAMFTCCPGDHSTRRR
jgi:hypothetical protein